MRLSLWVLMVGVMACGSPREQTPAATAGEELAIVPDVSDRLEQFVPTDLVVDLASISPADRQVLVELLGAARIMDEIFLVQVAEDNPQTWQELVDSTQPGIEAAREYFAVNFGPWDRLAEFEPFVGETPHPEGAGFYPTDMSREDFERWIADHPENAESFKSLFTVIRREGEKLVAIP